MGTRITASFLWRKWHQGVSVHGREGEWERHICAAQAYSVCVCFETDFQWWWNFHGFVTKNEELSRSGRAFLSCCSTSVCSGPPKGQVQTVTVRSTLWLRWEGPQVELRVVVPTLRGERQGPLWTPPPPTPCLCWPTDALHPSVVTPGALHKVNLPLKIWYLLTCLIEFDGCMTFIEFFLISCAQSGSERLGCYSSWTRALAGIWSPPQTAVQMTQPRFTDHAEDRRLTSIQPCYFCSD